MGEIFTETKLPQQKSFSSAPLPAVLSPATPISLPQLTGSVNAQIPYLNSLLRKSGALLFRGFPVNSASEFNDFVEAFGFEELPYIGGAAPRRKVVGRVFTANESPPDQTINFHHEMAHVPWFPSKIFFFCEEEPGSGGETPIVLSNVVYEKMKEKYPDFVDKLDKNGLIYTLILGEEDDPSSWIGRGWKSMFKTQDKTVAEKSAAALGMKLEWIPSGVKIIMGPMAGTKYDESRQQNMWFNSMMSGWKDSRNDPAKAVTFGNGEPLPSEVVVYCQRINHEECVAIPWKKGDVLLIDNLAVLHARRSYTEPRRILVSLCK